MSIFEIIYFWLNPKKKKDYLAKKNKAINYEMDPDVAIELQNITFKADGQIFLNNFSFKFRKNLIYSVIGPTGSGKTILSNHFNGLNKSQEGNVYLFNGEKILFFEKKIRNYQKLRQTVGMVLQFPEYQIFKETVISDVCYGPKMLNINDANIEAKAKEILRELGFPEDLFYKNPFMLSGGQKRKVALAGILVIDPSIIVFDEPTIGLDPATTQTVMDLIKKLKAQKKTIVVISSNMDLVLELSDEILVLDKGNLIDYGDSYDVFKNMKLNIVKPKIISFIEKLCIKNEKFKKLWKLKPKTTEELANSIAHVLQK